MKILKALIVTALVFTITGCQSNESESNNGNTNTNAETETNSPKSNVLVVYFSLYENMENAETVDVSTSASVVLTNDARVGTTKYMADQIQAQTNADMYSIEMVDKYSDDFEEVVSKNREEQSADSYPELVDNSLNIDAYDTVFIGYPIWATTTPRAINSFLQKYNLENKTVIPFCTHDGYGSGNSFQEIETSIGTVNAKEGLAIAAEDIVNSESTITEWLATLELDTEVSDTMNVTIGIGDNTLNGYLNNTAEAQQFSELLPQTITMGNYGDREYYGALDGEIEVQGEGQLSFEDGDITYCPTNNSIAIFYQQTDSPNLTMEVYVIGKVTSSLDTFMDLDQRIDVTFTAQ